MAQETPHIRIYFLRVMSIVMIGCLTVCYLLLKNAYISGLQTFLVCSVAGNLMVLLLSYSRFHGIVKSIFLLANSVFYAWLGDMAGGFYLVYFFLAALMAFPFILFSAEEWTYRNINILFAGLLMLSYSSSINGSGTSAEIPFNIVPVYICIAATTFFFGLFLWKISNDPPVREVGK